MASNPSPQDSDDTAFLIIIFTLVVLLLGLAPVVVSMYLDTKSALEQLEDETKHMKRFRREMEQQQRKEKRNDKDT